MLFNHTAPVPSTHHKHFKRRESFNIENKAAANGKLSLKHPTLVLLQNDFHEKIILWQYPFIQSTSLQLIHSNPQHSVVTKAREA